MHQLTLCLFFHPPFFPVCLTHSPPYSYAPLSIYPSIFFMYNQLSLSHTLLKPLKPHAPLSLEGHPYNSLASEVCPPQKNLPSHLWPIVSRNLYTSFLFSLCTTTLYHACIHSHSYSSLPFHTHTHTSVPTPSSVFTSCRHTPTHSHTGGFSSTLPVWLHTSSWITCYTTSPVMHSCATVPLVWLTLISFLP